MPSDKQTTVIRRERTKRPLGVSTIQPKALDYAWACKDGVLKCFNTHGLTINNFDQWTVVHNEANCNGTAKPNCAGDNWWGTGPGGAKGPNNTTQAPYDYVAAIRTGKSRVDLFGVIVRNDEAEDYYPLNLAQFKSLTGQKNVLLSGNRRVYRPYYLTGDKLFQYNAEKYKVSTGRLDTAKRFLSNLGVKTLLPFTEFLDYYGVPVKDGNDIAEVITKYVAFTQPNIAVVNQDYANKVNTFYQKRFNSDVIPMEKSLDIGGFDISSIINAGIEIVSGWFAAGQQEETRRQLIEWLNWFNNQMQIDYNDLQTFRAEKGARFAADYITQLENTSWRDIRNYITNWSSGRGIPTPPVVKEVYDNFTALKLKWIEEASRPEGQPGYTPAPTDEAPGGTPPGDGTPSVGLLVALALGAIVVYKIAS